MTTQTLPRLVRNAARLVGPRPVLIEAGAGTWREITWVDLWASARDQAGRLLDAGLAPGEVVAIFGDGSASALIAEIGVHAAGGVACPVSGGWEMERLAAALEEVRPRFLLVAADARARVRPALERVRRAPEAMDLVTPSVQADARPSREPGAASPDPAASGAEDPRIAADLDNLGPLSTATVVFTAGTTRPARQVPLNHSNLLDTGAAVAAALGAGEGDIWHPLRSPCHPFLRMVSWYAALASGGCTFLATPGTDPLHALWIGRPTLVSGFDADVAALAERVAAEVAGMPGLVGRMVRWGLKERARPRPASGWDRVRRALADEVVGPRLWELLGGSLRHVIVGQGRPGPTSQSLAAFGCQVLEAYGLAEASGIVTLQRPGTDKAGIPLEGVGVMVAESGEIRVWGVGVMVPHAALRPGTEVVFDNGLLCTGDLGRLEPDGRLVVIGRIDRQNERESWRNLGKEP